VHKTKAWTLAFSLPHTAFPARLSLGGVGFRR
jgi:hypothetical protein